MALSAYPALIETVFTGNPLDRADNLRNNEGQMDAWLDDPDSRVMIVQEGEVLIDERGGINWLPLRKLRWVPLIEKIFLGLEGGQPRFAASVDHGAEEALTGHFANLRDYASHVTGGFNTPHPDLAIIAQAKSMLAWHESHKHCSACGQESHMVRAGYERRCPACDVSHFPRTDPVVIMLAIHATSDCILVGRPPHLHPGVYTALAGFMEPGERIEEAVARELMEEAGVNVTGVKYIASQPWPYPSSLMIGCHAQVDSRDFTMDTEELEDLIWLTRNEAKLALKGSHKTAHFPPSFAIARQLIEAWLQT